METSIRPARESDAVDIADIYNPYVLGTCISFETEPVRAPEMARRIGETLGSSLPWLVAEASGGVVGYAYASRWKSRRAYRHSVESSVYMNPAHTGKGVGLRLYSALIEALRASSVHAVMGGIALPNASSVGLHERLGFKKVAHFEQAGYKEGRWIDVGYWQLLLA
ncbi:MAG: GNAT family N-acetyltransferase [Candidatus Accumulibacter sp.]|nr:GNAT family N-acetyltransferase [Accumulibacter sp.]